MSSIASSSTHRLRTLPRTLPRLSIAARPPSHRRRHQDRRAPPPPRSTTFTPPIAILAGIWSFFTDSSSLSPQTYTRHRITAYRVLSPTHVYLEITLSPTSAALFHRTDVDGRILIHHVCVKSPDLVIERPYTPINDVAKDGKIKLVVKRVKGGEVGRCDPNATPVIES